MILYKDNPNLGLRTVKTIQGDTEYRRNCKYIQLKYYLMDRDCIFIDDKWYRTDTGNIVYDHELKVWVLKAKAGNLYSGIVDFKNGEPVIGYYTHNVYENVDCKCKRMGQMNAMSGKLLHENGYFEDIANCFWYKIKDMTSADYRHRKSIRNERNFNDRGYNIEDNSVDYINKIRHYQNYPTPISNNAKAMAKYLGDYTFGCELEIAQGNVPRGFLNKHGIVICRDGSIDGGPELVTIPIQGAKGLQNIIGICEGLKGRTIINIACALHIHIGNVKRDKLFIVAYYLLCRKIQDEIFTMFPYYKTDWRGIKKKNYNQKLDKLGIHPLVNKDKDSIEFYINDVYERIFNFLAEGRITLDEVNKKTREHPIRHKWERKSRYYWANTMNMFFTNRNTLESRLHGPTKNAHKIINWLFINIAIIRYAELNALEILTTKRASIPLKEVFHIFKDVHPRDTKAVFLGEYLYAYYLERRERIHEDIENGDKLSAWDINEDDEYEFSHGGVTGLV